MISARLHLALAVALLAGCFLEPVQMRHGPVSGLPDQLVDDALNELGVPVGVSIETSFIGRAQRWDGGAGWLNHGEYHPERNAIEVALPMPWLVRAICHEPLHREDHFYGRMVRGDVVAVHRNWADAGHPARERRCQAALLPRFDGGVYVSPGVSQLTGSSGESRE